MKKTRIFLGLLEVAGYYENLKIGFEELGVECTFIDLGGNNLFQYGGSDTPNIIVSWKKWISKKVFLNRNVILKPIYFFLSCIFSFLFFYGHYINLMFLFLA